MQQSRAEKLIMPPSHTASTAENQLCSHGQDSKETLLASSDNSNNSIPKVLEIQLLKRRNNYVLYSQSFVSILDFSTSLKKSLQHVSAKWSMPSVKASTIIYVYIGCNDGSEVKSSGWTRGPMFYSQQPHGSSQLSVVLVPRALTLSSGLGGY